MSRSHLPLSFRPAFLPEEISKREFGTVFRGYDPAEIRTFLIQLSEQAAESADFAARLQERITELEAGTPRQELTEETVTALLGEHTTMIIRQAREAALEMTSRAEKEAGAMLREAHEASGRLRSEAEDILEERLRQAAEETERMTQAAQEYAENAHLAADRAASSLNEETNRDCERIRSETQSEIALLRDTAERELQEEKERFRQQARELIATARHEAQSLVERTRERQDELIESLVRKRKIALAQVEELRAGRERLLSAYRIVRGTLDEVTTELERVEDEARNNAVSAGKRAAKATGIDPTDLEQEVEILDIDDNDDVPTGVIDLIDSFESPSFTGGLPAPQSPSMSNNATSNVATADAQTEIDVSLMSTTSDFSNVAVTVVPVKKRSDILVAAHEGLMSSLRQTFVAEQVSIVDQLCNADVRTVEEAYCTYDDHVAFYHNIMVGNIQDVVYAAAVCGESAMSSGELAMAANRAHTDQIGSGVAQELSRDLTNHMRSAVVPTVETLLAENNSEYEVQRTILESCVRAAFEGVDGIPVEELVATHLSRAFDVGVAMTSSGQYGDGLLRGSGEGI